MNIYIVQQQKINYNLLTLKLFLESNRKMSKIDAEVNKFVKLLQAKNTKEAKLYLDRIQKFQDGVEDIVSKGLEKCLVNKATTPLGLISALYIYKQMLIRSQFDVFENENFNEKIQKFPYEVCQFNYTKPIDQRGKDYFKQKMKAPQSQENQMMGVTLVQMALEIIQAMANWYPTDFFAQEPSIYKQFYNKLKQKNVSFPLEKDMKYMKSDDKKRFQKFYLKFVERMNQVQSQENKDKQQTKKQPPAVQEKQKKSVPKDLNQINKNSTNLLDPKNMKSDQSLKNKQQFVKINSNKIQSKIIDSSKQSVDKKVVASNISSQKEVINPASKKQLELKDTINNTKSNVPKNQNPKLQEKKISQTQIQSQNSGKKQPTKQKEPLASFILEPPKEQKKVEIPKIDVKDPSKITPRQNIQKEPSKKQIQNPQTNRPESSRSKQQNQQSKQSQKQIEQNKPKQTVQKNKTPEKSDISPPKPEPLKNSQVHKVLPRMQVSQKIHQISQSPHIKYGSKEIKQLNGKNQRRTEQFFGQIIHPPKVDIQTAKYNEEKFQKSGQNIIPKESAPQFHKKAYRTQKPIQPSSQTQNINFKQRRKSLPKTEKKNFNMPMQGIQFINLSPEKKQKILSNNEIQTLSDLRNMKNFKKIGHLPMNQFIQNEAIVTLIEKARLNEITIPFLPQYFHPVDIKMEALILQSLRLRINPQFEPSKLFYQNQDLAIRLIKSQKSLYILSLHNISHRYIQVGFSHALLGKYGNQFSCQIKVRGLEKKKIQQVLSWMVNPNQFVDISFQFSTIDANFKFLQFPVAVNNKIITLHLPITLLDQGRIQKHLDMEQISSYIELNGRILKSPPVSLSLTDKHQHFFGLPPFFSQNKSKGSRILGHLSFVVDNEYQIISKISILVKQVSNSPIKHEILALYDNRLEQNENFAKVLIQLLCFLLSKHH